MSDNGQKSFDEMFAASQKSNFSNPKHPPANPVQQGTVLKQGTYQEEYLHREEAPAEAVAVTDRNETPEKKKKDFFAANADAFGIIAIVCAVLAFIFVFVGMFAHVFLWLGLFLCLGGIVLSIIALLQPKSFKPLGVIGILACLFSLVFDVVCMLVAAVTSGISSIINMFS